MLKRCMYLHAAHLRAPRATTCFLKRQWPPWSLGLSDKKPGWQQQGQGGTAVCRSPSLSPFPLCQCLLFFSLILSCRFPACREVPQLAKDPLPTLLMAWGGHQHWHGLPCCLQAKRQVEGCVAGSLWCSHISTGAVLGRCMRGASRSRGMDGLGLPRAANTPACASAARLVVMPPQHNPLQSSAGRLVQQGALPL